MIQKGQITLFGGDFVPEGWVECNGEDGTPTLPPLVYDASNEDSIPYLMALNDVDDHQCTLGTIVLLGSNFFTPLRWFPCDGRLLNISQHVALYSVLRTRYGGDGRQDFAIPNIANQKAENGSSVPYMICVEGAFPMRS